MLIKGEDNITLELKVNNYEFPHITWGEYGNWLNIYFNIKSSLGKWETFYPCLRTWDVKEIIEWLKNLADNIGPKWKDQEFIEINISFQLLNNFNNKTKQIRCKINIDQFEKEFKPFPVNNYNEFSIIFYADSIKLHTLAEELQIEYDKFPIR